MARDPETDETPQAKALRALMGSAAWTAIYRRLLAIAEPLAPAARLEPGDLLQMALARAYAVAVRGEGAIWDAAQAKPFVTHMLGVMKSERWHVLKRGYVPHTVHESDRNEPGEDDEGIQEPYVETVAHPDGDAEDALHEARRLRRAERNAKAVEARLGPLARLVFRALLVDPVAWDPDAFARLHRVDIQKVYRAREDVTRHTAAVMKDAPDSERDGGTDEGDDA